MKVLITGGAGFLGINLVRFLVKKDHEVISYDFADFDYPEKDKIQVITKDIRNKADLDIAMQGVDIVVHCAAALPLYSKEDIYTTDVDGTRNVLTSAFEHGVQRVIHISSTAVYGIPDHHPLYEYDKVDGVGAYGEAKILAEQECEKFRAQGKCVSVIRPKSF
ncbi:MAG: NAD-dependent epimerase/dehydratase family protein, partial [Candidatus Andersenbacteria bacterium]